MHRGDTGFEMTMNQISPLVSVTFKLRLMHNLGSFLLCHAGYVPRILGS
jgi:hypothetical protein